MKNIFKKLPICKKKLCATIKNVPHQESDGGEGDVDVDGLESVPRGDVEGGGEGGGREVGEEVCYHQLETLETTPY